MRLRRDRRLAEIERLYESRRSHFMRVARAITGDGERASEAVQDAFVNVIRGRASFRGDAPLEAWVWQAVVNAARKAVRSPLVEVTVASPDAGEVPPALPELAPLVSSLPERQRLILFLRYYADLDYRAIAAALEIEVGTVSASLAAAHRSIRRALQEVRADA
jgi:DNA-directed RNA polymerase specialized sigma24 family protein